MRKLHSYLLFLMCGLFCSCSSPFGASQGGSEFGSPAPVVLKSLQVSPSTASVALGLTQNFTLSGIFSDGSTSNLSSQTVWSVQSGSGNAAISTAGALTTMGGSVGTVTVVGSYSGQIATAQVTILPAAVVSIALSPTSPTIGFGSTEQFSALGTFTDGTSQDITSSGTWSVTNLTGRGSVNSSGLVSTIGGWSGTVTVKVSANAANANTTLTISPLPAPTSLTATTASTAASLSWSTTTGYVATGYLLVRSTAASVTFSPTNGTLYSDTVLDANQTIIYVGSNASFVDTGLVGGTKYAYAVFAYDGSNRYTSSATGSFIVGCDDLGGQRFLALERVEIHI